MRSLARLLKTGGQALLSCWLGRVQALVSPRKFSPDELTDNVPGFLAEIAGSLSRWEGMKSSSALPEHSIFAPEHGRQRIRLGFDAWMIAREYSLLRDCILDYARGAGLTPPLAEIQHLLRCIDTGQFEALTERVKDLRAKEDHERLERRHLGIALEQKRAVMDYALFENAPVSMALVQGKAHVYEYANRLYRERAGKHRELVGRPAAEAVPELVPQGFLRLLDHVYKTGEHYVGREQLVRLDRAGTGQLTEAYLTFIFEPVRGSSGNIERIAMFGYDVTNEVLARRKQEATAAQLQTILDSIPANVYMVDEQGVRKVNEYGFRLVGFDSAEGYQRTLPEFIERLQPRFYATGEPVTLEQLPLRRALRGETVMEELIYKHQKTGKDIVMRSTAAPMMRDGKCLGAVVISIDITELKRQEVREKRRAEFEQQLIGIVSHDLRNPLNAIRIGAQSLLRREALTERQTAAVSRILSSADRATRLIRDLLDFTQARLGGGLPVQVRAMDLFEFCRQILEEIRSTYPERDFQLVHKGETTGEWDDDRLTQLLTNLTTNAVKYGVPGTPITISVQGRGDEVTLSVHNVGPAISEEMREKLFEPLQRGGQSLADAAGRSVGLGLYIVRQIAESHGGRVQVRSTDDEGTTFSVQLPRGRAWRGEEEHRPAP